MTDSQLQYDAAQMQSLLEHTAWAVLTRHIDRMQQTALDRVMSPSDLDQNTHHWRGVYTAITDLKAMPQRLIDAERAARDASRQQEAAKVHGRRPRPQARG